MKPAFRAARRGGVGSPRWAGAHVAVSRLGSGSLSAAYRFLDEVDEVDEVDIDVMDQTLCNAWTSPMLSDLCPDLYDNG